MKYYLNDFIKNIREPYVMKLVDELEKVTQVKSTVFHNEILLHYLQQCLRPNGASTKQILLNGAKIKPFNYNNDFILMKKVKQYSNTELYWLFIQLANLKENSIEQVHLQNKTIYVFINYCLKAQEKKKKRNIDSVNYLWR